MSTNGFWNRLVRSPTSLGRRPPCRLAAAFSKFQVDGQPAAEVHQLAARKVHDLEIAVRMSRSWRSVDLRAGQPRPIWLGPARCRARDDTSTLSSCSKRRRCLNGMQDNRLLASRSSQSAMGLLNPPALRCWRAATLGPSHAPINQPPSRAAYAHHVAFLPWKHQRLQE